MSIYISRVEVVEQQSGSRFVNFRPRLLVNSDGTLTDVDPEYFGQYGTVNIYGAQYDQYRNSEYLVHGKYYQVTLSEDDIAKILNHEDFNTGRLKPQIRVLDYLERCSFLPADIISEVIQLPKQYKINEYHKWKDDYLLNLLPPFVKSVYLEDTDCIAGPFTWDQSSENQYNFIIDIHNNPSQDKYMIPYYDKQSFNKNLHYFEERGSWEQLNRQVFNPQQLPEIGGIFDCIDDEKLKKLLVDQLSLNAASNADFENTKAIIENLPSESFSDARKDRIFSLLENSQNRKQIINLIPRYMMGSDEYKDELVSVICGNIDYLDELLPKIKEHGAYLKKIAGLDAEIGKKQEILEQLDHQKAEQTQISPEIVEEYENKVKETVVELDRTKSELDKTREELEQYRKVENIQKQYEIEKAELDELERRKDDLYATIGRLSSEVKEKITSAYANLAIDGAISSMMIHEAAEFERQENQKKMQGSVSSFDNIEHRSSIKTASELVDFIHNELKSVNRFVEKNDIANLLICVSQGFLTVLAGEPGCGKTSLVSLLAQILGLSNPLHTRYQEIAVEKGWTSRRDLIGYYNPLTKSFEAANKGMFTALATSEEEYNQNITTFPYWILLDEANLSQMEHYWADFMGICDLDKAVRQISLNEDYVFRINPTLRFLATINLDHTTEVLSPRLIDRAWIIKLKAADVSIDKPMGSKLDREYPLVEFDVFKQLSSPELMTETLDQRITDHFNNIRKVFHDTVGIDFSPRVVDMIRRYCIAGQGLIDISKNNYTNSYAILDYAISQKILPMIDGYGKKYKNLVEDLLNVCDSVRMPICNNLLQEILKKGESNMQYYQFFAR